MFLTFSAAGLRVHWNADHIVQMVEEDFALTIVDVHGVKHHYAEITALSWSDKPDMSYWQPSSNLAMADREASIQTKKPRCKVLD